MSDLISINIQHYFDEKKNLYEKLMAFIDSHSVNQNTFTDLINIIKTQKIEEDSEEFKLFIYLIKDISDNYHRDDQFLNKIEKILLEFTDKIKQTFSNIELCKLFERNKFLLLFLFESKIITVDESIYKEILELNNQFSFENENETDSENDSYGFDDEDQEEKTISNKEILKLIRSRSYTYYFYPEIKKFLNEEERNQIENELEQILDKNYTIEFENKRKIGQNHSYISQLIQQDSIDKFISYVHQNNISLSSQLPPSIFETNSILIEKDPSLIEYAAFYGSIQILKYLQINEVEINQSIWIYAIHSNNKFHPI